MGAIIESISSAPQAAYSSTEKLVEGINDLPDNVKKYSKFGVEDGTTSLAFRDVPKLFSQYVSGQMGIDYGCGSGRSTRFLRSIGLSPIGVDISDLMLAQAKSLDISLRQKNCYMKIKSGEIPIANKTCDFVFSSFVFLVIPSKKEIVKVLNEMHRVLKDNGSLIIATGSENMHLPNLKWVSYDTDFPENYSLKSGSLAKVRIKEVGAEFYDYNWLNEDYMEAFDKSGFIVEAKLTPVADVDVDGPKWKDEVKHSPYYIYVAKKKMIK